MSKLKPLAGYVLIEPLDEEQTTASGLVMPDKEKEKPAKGKVIAVGESPVVEWFSVPLNDEPQPVREDPPVEEGQTVVFHKWAGQDVKKDNKEYRFVKFSDLMGVEE